MIELIDDRLTNEINDGDANFIRHSFRGFRNKAHDRSKFYTT